MSFLQFRGLLNDGNLGYVFHCKLDKFDPSNEFSKSLAPFVNNAHQFCTQLCTAVTETIEFESNAVDEIISQSAPSTSISSASSTKRCSDFEPIATKKRKISKVHEDQNRLKEEIPEHHIGMPHALLLTCKIVIANNGGHISVYRLQL
jgi:phosphate starvation-inducible protein PhoH